MYTGLETDSSVPRFVTLAVCRGAAAPYTLRPLQHHYIAARCGRRLPSQLPPAPQPHPAPNLPPTPFTLASPDPNAQRKAAAMEVPPPRMARATWLGVGVG